MQADAVRTLAMSLPGATEQVQWGDNRVFKIGGKMFAVSGTDTDSLWSLKVEDDRFLELTGLPGVAPAPYLARARWVQIDPAECALSIAELEALLREAYAIIFARLPKKTQRELAP